MTFRAQIEEHLLDLAWRQWTTLGVAGVHQEYGKLAVAPEELILLTAALVATDPRLRDESLDWCVQYDGFVSKTRLKNLLSMMPAGMMKGYAEYAATVNAHSKARWPRITDTQPWQINLSGKSKLPSLERPALLHLRLRALFGVNARADVVGALLSGPDPRFTASDLVELGYTKRNIANTLDSLTASGLLRATRVQNRIRVQLQKRTEMEQLLKPLPDRIPRWPAIIRLLIRLLGLAARLDSKSDTVCGVEATKFLHDSEKDLTILNLQPPALVDAPTKTWTRFQSWATKGTKALAEGTSPMLAAAW